MAYNLEEKTSVNMFPLEGSFLLPEFSNVESSKKNFNISKIAEDVVHAHAQAKMMPVKNNSYSRGVYCGGDIGISINAENSDGTLDDIFTKHNIEEKDFKRINQYAKIDGYEFKMFGLIKDTPYITPTIDKVNELSTFIRKASAEINAEQQDLKRSESSLLYKSHLFYPALNGILIMITDKNHPAFGLIGGVTSFTGTKDKKKIIAKNITHYSGQPYVKMTSAANINSSYAACKLECHQYVFIPSYFRMLFFESKQHYSRSNNVIDYYNNSRWPYKERKKKTKRKVSSYVDETKHEFGKPTGFFAFGNREVKVGDILLISRYAWTHEFWQVEGFNKRNTKELVCKLFPHSDDHAASDIKKFCKYRVKDAICFSVENGKANAKEINQYILDGFLKDNF